MKVNYEILKSDLCILYGIFFDWCIVFFFVIGKRERLMFMFLWRENGIIKIVLRGLGEESFGMSLSWIKEKGG